MTSLLRRHRKILSWVAGGCVGFFPALALCADLAPVSCLIEPRDIVKLSTPVSGVVASVAVDRGSRVKKGDEIARLDTALEEVALTRARLRAKDRAEIEALETRITFLTQQADRTAQLAKRNAVSSTAADEAKLDLALARSELSRALMNQQLAVLDVRRAEAELQQKIVTSPVDGVVTQRLLSPGEYREGEAHIATIAEMDSLVVEAFVPISYFGQIQIGQPVQIRPEAPLDQLHPATITVIDQVFDAATATVGIRMALPNPDLVLPAGLRCTLYFSTNN
ncbi:efflux RND transporter periplasmic adaptor subunit [Pseudosulfitobacter sp. DSM 107133]|jgi:RND family efflux transporter MFP subunit|uniref:efflux RND transporter periplasmic adaptor subunit n=1 Tax=Pseudosulfitobacter sp. DSM 107133 TaxID=2883100 RepID=UPI000DF1D68E|nr:efflux RND transporter periplasmic adaptor subunit [Pseudosulfitobacter sp. DSM 107133]UOA28925.1 Multidrug resistance protein MdtE [Pseudosulfitobacter sp. DSM 107133]